jgi:predicted phosphoribosyltransferase
VALTLNAPLDAFTVRKLGVPGHEELAMGAIATGGIHVTIPDVIREFAIDDATLDAVIGAEQVELERRERAYRDSRPFPTLEGRTVILVDDGIATGASMVAAVRAVKEKHPRFVVAAAPVMSRSAAWLVREYADACEAVLVLEEFYGVGFWYGDFSQTPDEEVRALLESAAARRLQKSTAPMDTLGRST